MSEGRLAEGVQVNEVPVAPEVIAATVLRSVLAPFLRVRVTGPVASDQVMVKGWPAVTEKSLLVSLTAWARAAKLATRAVVKVFIVTVFGLFFWGRLR